MSKNLMIVESPAKASTIEKFLGPDFIVKSCYGHIRDLAKSKLAVDTENNYTPEYEIPKDKAAIVKELKAAAKAADVIWLATDEDREGEAISWHLLEALNLDRSKVRRVVFHEITKSAIQEAVANPREIDQNLVNAQQARRILDRLVGFELSPVLWKKISSGSSLSAGRVQSVAVRLLVEREREVNKFTPVSSYKVIADFTLNNGETEVAFKANLPKRYDTEQEATSFLQACSSAEFEIKDIQVKPSKRSPNAPFTTSTLQQEASRKLGYSVTRTMVVAQKLYEAGHISYMRTDSVNLSDEAIKHAAEAIVNSYGENYLENRQYKTKTANSQEAHEGIRPTDFANQEVTSDNDEQRLYDLIWKRAISSQMADARIEKTTARISISTNDEEFIAAGEVIKFDGFLKIYEESTDEDTTENDENGILPPMNIGDKPIAKAITATERFSRPPARYTEASLVRKLEELGIGRPSTYAPTIGTIQKRGYCVKEQRDGQERQYKVISLSQANVSSSTNTEIYGAEKSKLFPTDMGMVVNDFLTEYFEKVMDYGFTAKIEEEFDQIANGHQEWIDMIDSFYKPFHEKVENTTRNAERTSGQRELGTDPKTGLPVFAKVARYGPVVQLGEFDENDDTKKPKFASIKPPLSIETITLEDALPMFKLPRTLGEYEGVEVTAAEGRYGPYVAHNKKFYAIKDKFDPLEITLDESIQVIKDKIKTDAEKTIKNFEENDIQILNGPYGPYIKSNGRNVRIPKEKEPAALTLEECLEIIEKAPLRKRRARKKK